MKGEVELPPGIALCDEVSAMLVMAAMVATGLSPVRWWALVMWAAGWWVGGGRSELVLAEVVEVVTGEVWGEALWCDRVSAALALVDVG